MATFRRNITRCTLRRRRRRGADRAGCPPVESTRARTDPRGASLVGTNLRFRACCFSFGVASWSWFYPHHHAPTMSDIHRFLMDHADKFEARFEFGAPLSPDEQLLCVLPPQSFDLLSDVAKIAAQRLPFYPSSFGEDCVHKQQRWQTIPDIPFIEVQKVRRALHKRNRN